MLGLITLHPSQFSLMYWYSSGTLFTFMGLEIERPSSPFLLSFCEGTDEQESATK